MKINLKNLDLDLYKETLDNGLLIYICPMKKHDTHASIVTKYGNDILDFKPFGKEDFIKIPDGTAHFLEHKMFASEEGPHPMVLFSNNGASANAYTSSNITRYYFTGASDFYKNLKILLDCITTPYFTEENILKEQGIIEQEINSGLDNPYQRITYLANENLFINHSHKYPVAGSVDSINKLNPEILLDCFNTFYNPCNMYLVITGDVDPEKAITFVKNYYNKKSFKKEMKIEKKYYKEPNEVNVKKSSLKMDITNKILNISYKVKVVSEEEKFLTTLYLLIYLDALFSEMSEFYERIHLDKNILSSVNYYIENVDDFVIIYFDVEVMDDEDILKEIDKEIKKKYFSCQDFDLIVKNIVKSAILSTESVNGMANLIVNQELNYGKFYDNFYEIYKNLSYDDCLNFIKSLDFNESTISIINSLKKSD